MESASIKRLGMPAHDPGSAVARAGPLVLPTAGCSPAELAPVIAAALRAYPHFAVLRGLVGGEDRQIGEEIVRAVARGAKRLVEAPAEQPKKISFTRVRIDSDTVARDGAVTRYSRTHLALPPHSDSAYSERPHSLVAFHMIRRDPLGGLSTIVPVADVVASLPHAAIAILREPRFAFGREDMPILWGPRGGESMRYYRAQIETALRMRGLPPFDPTGALDVLDDLLASIAERRTFRLCDSEMLLLNNHKVLHGRTAFAPDSDRLMYRFRAHAGELE